MNFTVVNVDWYINTFVFYLAIIIGSYFITTITKNKNIVLNFTHKKRIYIWSLLITVLLMLVKGFGTTGRDLRTGYYFNFISATSMQAFHDQSIEIGYRILNVIVRTFTKQYWVFIFVVSLMTLYPVISLIKKYSDRIDIPISITLYTSLFFFNGFSLLRIVLAASLALYAFDAMVESKPVKALFWIVVGSCFHISVMILILPYFFSMAKIFDRKLIAISLFIFFMIIYIGKDTITSYIASSERYFMYKSSDVLHIGMEQFIYYLPLFWLYFVVRKNIKDKQFSKVSFGYLTSSFCCGMLGYVFSIFGRLQNVLSLPMIIIVPFCIILYKEEHPNMKNIVNITALAYCIIRFYIYIYQYYNIDDLMPYTNIFGLIID